MKKKKKTKKGKKRVTDDMMDIDEPIYEVSEFDEAIDNPSVLNKYLKAGEIAKKVIQSLLVKVKAGVRCFDMCKFGDNLIMKLLSEVKFDNVKKQGIAFPTCVCNGRLLCNFSAGEEDQRKILPGDEVRIDLGVHIDGFAAIVGTTMFLEGEVKSRNPKKNDSMDMEMDGNFGQSPSNFDMEELRAKCVFLAKLITNLSMKMMKPGERSSKIGEITNKLCEEYGVVFVKGILSHEVKRFVLDGCSVILHNPTVETQAPEFKFKKNTVFCLDIAISPNIANEGKSREENFTPVLLKREVSNHQIFLKYKSAEKLLRIIDEKYDSFPFPLREVPSNLRLGLSELKSKGLVIPFPVLFRKKKSEDLVVRVQSTVLIGENKIVQLTEPYFQKKYLSYKANEIMDPEVKKVFKSSLEF